MISFSVFGCTWFRMDGWFRGMSGGWEMVIGNW